MIPGGRIVQAAGPNVTGIPVVIDLPHAGGIIAVVLEHLRQRHHVRQHGSEIRLQVMNSSSVRPQPRQQRDTAWTAQRKLVIGAVESEPARGKTIEVGTLDQRVPIRAQVIVEIVGDDEQHVRPAGLR